MYGILKPELEEIKNKHPSQYKDCFDILIKLFTNIVNNPNEAKFRNFKKTNKAIETRVLVIPEILEILSIMGYSDSSDPDVLIFEGDTLQNFNDAIKILKELTEEPEPKDEEEPVEENQNEITSGTPVMFYQYDLTQGMAKSFGKMLIGRPVEGIWHTAVVVFGKEYFYGGGIQIGSPKQTPYGIPVKEVKFGYTDKDMATFEKYLKTIDSKFSTDTYDVLKHNCNHFTDNALYYLTGKHLPNAILNQHEQLLSTPMGKMIRPMLENMSQSGNNAALPNMFENRGGYGGFPNNFGGFGGGRGGYGGGRGGYGGYGGYP